MSEFDIKVPARELTEALEKAKSGDPADSARALELIDLDYKLRHGIEHRYGYSQREQELLFGRDGVTLAQCHGLTFHTGEQGDPSLVER
jgi:hypothetical protein